MKKILLSFFLFSSILVSQESKTTVLKIKKQIKKTYVSEILKVEQIANNPFVAFSIRLTGHSILSSIEAAYYKDFNGNWKIFPIDENNFEVNNWHAMTYLDTQIEQTQVKIVFTESTSFDNIKFNFYYPYKTEFLEKKVQKKSSDIESVRTKTLASCNCASPTVITRAGWCPNNDCPPNAYPNATDVKFLIVHHTAGSNTSSDWAAVVRSIWNYHVNSNGWSDIGYNFLLDKEGNIYEGREDDTTGAHFSGHNSGTSGVSLMGTYTTVTPTTVMIDSLKKLLAWKACVKNIDPTATSYHASSGSYIKTISGHRDGGSTECPGQKVYDLLPTIRTGVNSIMDSCNTLGVDNQLLNKVNVYPNPFSDKITIETSLLDNEFLKIECFDIAGKMVYENEDVVTNNMSEVDLSFLSTGIYWLKLKINNKIANYKLIKN
ncbi:T9SS C-terminal target domain-containing protein [Aureibaculum marinum]|uniref:T9SS C-terminal target domain-containing protein n=1 Tax=Aureibaculum marinum TaxID=2487930 RepID=A0A3N4NQR9_9FLAO|nr:N-acetylmuramoyl-L-alanine amidase [Aureibaculum marinum]RPD98574.1 T9SS C-terminal target domain-containing protein [Aureibaculum marinum]